MPKTSPEQAASALLQEFRIERTPVAVADIAKKRGVKVSVGPLPVDISGFLIREKGSAIIAVNSLHSSTRQRFTIAHELGHLEMGHPAKSDVYRGLNFRNEKSSQGDDELEIEANRFAASLLMPEGRILELVGSKGVDLEDEQRIQSLAKKFEVSPQALIFRLINLRLATQH